MARPTQRLTCRSCGRSRLEVGQMSWTGQCQECGESALVDNILGLANIADPTHDSPSGNGRAVRDRWRTGIARSLGLDASVIAD